MGAVTVIFLRNRVSLLAESIQQILMILGVELDTPSNHADFLRDCIKKDGFRGI